jgi:putative transposase
MIEPQHPALPITRQCELLGLARASYYHQPEPESDANLRLMRVIAETYLAYPVFRSRQMTRWLRRQGHAVNRKRVRRLMQQMGLEAIYRKPIRYRKHPQNPVFRYLQCRLVIDRPNQVWAMDITYVPIQGGFIYLCAVIDWYSRAVLAWELSNTIDARFCVLAMARAIAEHGVPEISNTNQGSQFTSAEFTQPLLVRGVKLSMDGRGRGAPLAHRQIRRSLPEVLLFPNRRLHEFGDVLPVLQRAAAAQRLRHHHPEDTDGGLSPTRSACHQPMTPKSIRLTSGRLLRQALRLLS